ncbi:MAG TPA: peptidase domain-containing ABC transporter [Saprospiraceae bacterium]|nr:peptidase domain-containing ABC transporter [Saprospiraceae bacterium]
MKNTVKTVHIHQQDQTDCGVACLKMVLQTMGSDAPLERLRELSGTSKAGTTMLGLLQSARDLGLDTEPYESDMKSLLECTDICILHVIKDDIFQHYIVYYGYDTAKNLLCIGDPAQSKLTYITPNYLEKIWKSHALLLLKPTPKLVFTAAKTKEKWTWIKSLVQQDMNLLLTSMVIGIVIAVLGLSTALFSQRLIDDFLPSNQIEKIICGTILLFVLLIVKAAASYIRGLFLIRQSKEFNERIIDFFYSSLLHLPKSFFASRKTGELITRMNDTQRIQRTISLLIGQSMIDVLLIIIASGFIFYYSWHIGLLSLIWLPVFAYTVYRFTKPIMIGQQNVMAAYARNESNYIDTIQGVDDIKLQNKQNTFALINQKVYGFFQQSIFDLSKIGIKFQVTTEIISSAFIVLIIGIGAHYVLKDIITVGVLMAILQMTGMVMTSAAQLAAINIQLQEAKVAFERMYDFASLESEKDKEANTAQAQINDLQQLSVANLTFRYPGRSQLLKEISFEIKKGEWISIMGESGCGKSTLMQILQKFYFAESGSIKANGVDFSMIAYEPWRSIIGVVPQEIKIFNGTLIDNILLGSEVKDFQELEQFFIRYGFDPFFSKFPMGYATLLGEEGVNISGGQKQLVGLARALYHKPQLLLLDEPTAALDRNTEQFVLQLLQNLKKEVLIISLTHTLKIAKASDRIYVIENGVIQASGTHNEVLATDNLYSQVWNDFVMVPIHE